MAVTVNSAGVDTWSPCWYVAEGSPAERAIDALATRPSARGRLVPDEIDGYRVGWFPGSRLVYAEGHGADGDELGPPAQLPDRLERVEQAIRDVGVPLPSGPYRDVWPDNVRRPGLAGVRRLDSTVDVGVPSSAEGLAIMAGIAALSPSRQQPVIRRQRGGRAVETVSWEGARGIVARVYDKGVESGTAARGQRIRLEAQHRWDRESRRDPAELTPAYVREKFRRRLQPLWRSSKGVVVAGPMVIPYKLGQLLESGEVTLAQAERMVATVVFDAAGVHVPRNERTNRRRQAELREHGLVLADGVTEEVEVDLHEVMEAVLDPGAWGDVGGNYAPMDDEL